MFKIPRHRPWPPVLDTRTARSELAQIRTDLQQVPDFHAAAQIIDEAIEEIENAERRANSAAAGWRLDLTNLSRPNSKR